MAFLWVVPLLLLPLLTAEGSSQLTIESCHDLKATIEGAASASSALTLQLRSDGLYRCMESIRVGEAQSVVITGGGDGLTNMRVSFSGCSHAARPSLFVNEGSLKLSNISIELHNARDDAVEGAGGSDDRRSRRQEKDEQQPACAGVDLIRNFGHAVVEKTHIFESGLGLARRRSGDEGALHGRVVYSGVASSSSSGSAVVSRSSFEVASCDHLGEGEAFVAEGGDLTVEGSSLDVESTPTFDTAASAPPSPGTRPDKPQLRPAGGGETVTASGRAGSAAFVAVDGELFARDTVFEGGFAQGGEERLVVLEESSDSREAEHLFAVDGCTFPPTRGSSSSSSSINGNYGEQISNLRRSRRRRRLRTTGQVLGTYLDEGLLLILVTAGLLLILAGMCVLDTWLRGHPDGIDRFLPRRYRIYESRRVEHFDSDTGGVDLSELEAAGFARVTKKVVVTDVGGGSHGALKTTSSQLLSDQYSVNERTYDQEVSFVMPQRYRDVLAKPAANSRSSSLRKGGAGGAASATSLSEDTATFTNSNSTESNRSNSLATLDLNRLTLAGCYENDDGETVYSTNSPTAAGAAAGNSTRGMQQFNRDKSGTQPPPPPPPLPQMQTSSQAPCLSPDSLDGAGSHAAPPSSLSVSTADEMYECGSRVLMTSPLPEGTLIAFASTNSRSSVALETSPITQAASAAHSRSLPAIVGEEEEEEEEETNVDERKEQREIMEAREDEKRETDGEEESEEEAMERQRGPVMWRWATSRELISSPLEKRGDDRSALGFGAQNRNISVLAAIAAKSFDSSSSALPLSLSPLQSSRRLPPFFAGGGEEEEEEEEEEEGKQEEGGGAVAKQGGGGGSGGRERKTALEERDCNCLSSLSSLSSSGQDSPPSPPARSRDEATRPGDLSLLLPGKPSPADRSEDPFLSLDLGDLGPAPCNDSYATERANLVSISSATEKRSTVSCFSPVVPLHSTKQSLERALQRDKQQQQDKEKQEDKQQQQQQQQQQAAVSPTGSSLSALSFGALSNMLQRIHGSDAIPEVLSAAHQFTSGPAAVPAAASYVHPPPEPDDGDMCYSPEANGHCNEGGGDGGGGNDESNSRVGDMCYSPDDDDHGNVGGGVSGESNSRVSDMCYSPDADDHGNVAGGDDGESNSRDGDMCYSPDADEPSDVGGGGGDCESNSRVFASSPTPLSGEVGRGELPAGETAEAETSCLKLPLPAGVSGGEVAGTEPPPEPPDMKGSEKPVTDLCDDMCYSPPSTGARAGERDDGRPFSLSPSMSPPGSSNKISTSKTDSTGGPFPQLAGYSPDCSRISLQLGLMPFSPSRRQEFDRHDTGGGELLFPPDGSSGFGGGGDGGRGAGSMTEDFSTICTTLTLSDVHEAAFQSLYCSPPSTSGGTPGVTPGGTPGVTPGATPTGVMVAGSNLLEEGRNAAARPVPQG
eukprot:g10419.t1